MCLSNYFLLIKDAPSKTKKTARREICGLCIWVAFFPDSKKMTLHTSCERGIIQFTYFYGNGEHLQYVARDSFTWDNAQGREFKFYNLISIEFE